MSTIMSKSEWDQIRRRDLIQAVEEKIEAGEDIPYEWIAELEILQGE